MERLKQTACFYYDDASGLSSHECHGLISRTQALARAEIQHDGVAALSKAVDSGMYRVPTTTLAACLMLDMLQ